MEITFKRVDKNFLNDIFKWLEEPHVKEFWDNSQAHKDDIMNFIHGRKEPSSYANGQYVYWIALADDVPYSLIMSIRENPGEDRPELKEAHLSKTGHTYGLDYMIGAPEYFGKGLGAKTLALFTHFFKENIDKDADTFWIDPDENNPRATHVYSKAGFETVGDFIMEGMGVFKGRQTRLMVKKL